ncbi:hypothetical protein [Flammeovirga aprica]|uniref:Uncharacterized protein n=1 Tax=Flammeovirga aprica JL-4 TaxID=694437 RepID=A0A7X9RXL0_9BACT|nr:hypothetical protein [Flammeovirga aprica]NME70622.1 hypothetical protein [Flammeovirga aprica JL-4]
MEFLKLIGKMLLVILGCVLAFIITFVVGDALGNTASKSFGTFLISLFTTPMGGIAVLVFFWLRNRKKSKQMREAYMNNTEGDGIDK